MDVTAIQPVRLQEIVAIPDSTRRERFAVSANQTLDGQVVSVEGDTLIVSIGPHRVPAQANPGTTLRPGEAIRLFVRDVDPDQVVMQIVARGASMQTMRSLTTQDLRAELTRIGVTPDDQAVEVARALINRGLPVTAQNVLEVRAGLTRLGGGGAAELDAAVFLKGQGLPITPDGVQIVRQALQSRSALGAQVEGLRTALADLAFRLTAQGIVPAPRGPIVTIAPGDAASSEADAEPHSTPAHAPAAAGQSATPRGTVPGAGTTPARAGPGQAADEAATADTVEAAAPAPSRPAGDPGEAPPRLDGRPRPAAPAPGGTAPADADAPPPGAPAPSAAAAGPAAPGPDGAPATVVTAPTEDAPPPAAAPAPGGAPPAGEPSADTPPAPGAPAAAPSAGGPAALARDPAAAPSRAAGDLDAAPAPGQGPGAARQVDGAPPAAATPPSQPPPAPAAATAPAGAPADAPAAPEPSLSRLLATVTETIDRLPLLDDHVVEAGPDAVASEIRRVIADNGTPVEAKLARVLEGLVERGDLDGLLATDLKSSLLALVRETQAQLAGAERLPPDTARDLRSVGQQAEALLGQVELQQLTNAAAGPDRQQPSYLMFQLPIPGGREPQSAQIRIKQESDGRTARIDPENVHVVFQLELQNLHTVRVGIRVVNRHLSCQMGSSDPTATELLAQHAPELREGLSGLGYVVDPIQTAVLTAADLLPAAAEPGATRPRPTMRVDARA